MDEVGRADWVTDTIDVSDKDEVLTCEPDVVSDCNSGVEADDVGEFDAVGKLDVDTELVSVRDTDVDVDVDAAVVRVADPDGDAKPLDEGAPDAVGETEVIGTPEFDADSDEDVDTDPELVHVGEADSNEEAETVREADSVRVMERVHVTDQDEDALTDTLSLDDCELDALLAPEDHTTLTNVRQFGRLATSSGQCETPDLH